MRLLFRGAVATTCGLSECTCERLLDGIARLCAFSGRVRSTRNTLKQPTGASSCRSIGQTFRGRRFGLLAALVFVSSLIGNSLTRNAFVGAIITVIIFVAFYVFWDYYPHNLVPGFRFPLR